MNYGRKQMVEQSMRDNFRDTYGNLGANSEEIKAYKLGTDNFEKRSALMQQEKKRHPSEFQEIQEENTEDLNKLYNDLAFNMDDWAADPIRRYGLEGAEFKASIPMGYGKRNIGNAAGKVVMNKYLPSKDRRESARMYIPGKTMNDPDKARLAVLGHELGHLGGSNEKYERSRDKIYSDINNYREGNSSIPDEYRDVIPFEEHFSGSNTEVARPENYGQDFKMIPTLANTENISKEQMNNLSSEDKLQMLNNSNNYFTSLGGNTSYDNPNLGVYDEVKNYWNNLTDKYINKAGMLK